MEKNNLSFVDLFCGAGGFSIGLESAGFTCIAGVDNWEPAVNTFSKNHKNSVCYSVDLGQSDQSTLINNIKELSNNIFLVVGGPPCQGFSLAGKKTLDDPRNKLVKNFVEITSIIEPEWFIIENVPQILSNHTFKMNLFQLIESKNYVAQAKIFISTSFGVPSKRKRAFIIGTKKYNQKLLGTLFNDHLLPRFDNGLKDSKNQQAIFPLPKPITFKEACSDLPRIGSGEGDKISKYSVHASSDYQKLMRGEISLKEFYGTKSIDVNSNYKYPKTNKLYNHIASDHENILIKRFQVIPQGGSKSDLLKTNPELAPPAGHAKQGLSYGKLNEDEPAGTIPANYGTPSGNRSIHPTIPRIITVREAMRLSSFPDYFCMEGSKVDQQFLIGNAITPLVPFLIGEGIIKLYEE